ncbi:uncharacterized protein FMAN_02202 [Fusarium mangiferae]|uniref:Uncharacterized protein n=1 Tax=Fusarium mangiferae TaxID=192010 RepID=A0A1L7TL19_FUSMA|nr:uncharacterized protein FMAN_02202 [Fusarium mangiferae]CVK99360.1 uncharacterized protein FMAN_02202 [Fusarium mangiferae]
MSTPSRAQVPRRGNPSPNSVHQSTKYSEQTNAWLREGQNDMPWNNIDSVEMSSNDNSESNPNTTASHNPAAQGSAKQALSHPHRPHYFVHQRPTQSPQRSSRHGHDLTRAPELERQHKRHTRCMVAYSRTQDLCIGVLNVDLASSNW